ncbi:MAG: tetratricopeptide repeat protein [Chloroflexia bacterium]
MRSPGGRDFPRSGPASYELGRIYGDVGRWTEALGALRSALLIEPDNPSYLHRYGAACLKTGAPVDALAYLRRSTALAPNQASAWADLADALAACAQPEAERPPCVRP